MTSLTSTLVTFPDGAAVASAMIVATAAHPDGAVIVTDTTPFHPIDHTWPDQPGDAGTIEAGEQQVEVREGVMAAVDADGAIAVGTDIPVKRGAPGWTWLVAHRLSTPDAPAEFGVGTAVRLKVDAARRASLSRGHSACHLASLALDLAVADLWRKDPGADALGTPDFEGQANQSSRIVENGAVDEYRLGKSLRKAGFDTEGFGATLAQREDAINIQLADWVADGGSSEIETDGPTIADRRRWRCDLPEGVAVIPCGGTHVQSLDEFASITVRLEMADAQTLVMTTTALRAD